MPKTEPEQGAGWFELQQHTQKASKETETIRSCDQKVAGESPGSGTGETATPTDAAQAGGAGTATNTTTTANATHGGAAPTSATATVRHAAHPS